MLIDLQNTKTFNNYSVIPFIKKLKKIKKKKKNSVILSHSHYKHKDLIQNTFNKPKVLTCLNPNLQAQTNPNGKNPI